MRYRELPVIARIKDIALSSPEEAKKFQDQIVLDLFKTPGFQLVMASIQHVEGEAFSALRSGHSTNTEQLVGRIQAADLIRSQLIALLPDNTALAESDAEEEAESEELYASGFAINYPSGV